MYKRKQVFAAACMGMLLFGICLITLGSVVTGLNNKLQLDEISAGTLFSILPLGILLGSIVFGPFCDKYGYKIMLVLSCMGMFAGFEGIAFARSRFLLQVCIFVFGMGGGVINGATNALVSDISDTGKGANLSLLGVFFGIGALGMPAILGALGNHFGFETITGAIGIVTLITGIFYCFIHFPSPKQKDLLPTVKNASLLKDSFLIMVAFYLFCQSSFEAIINNWTTTYLSSQWQIGNERALFSLSLFVAGMTAMRLMIGSVFRTVTVKKLLMGSFVLTVAGASLLRYGQTFNLATAGLVLLGAGLAGGFPIMLGIVGSRYKEVSGTAFSIVLTIALLGNTLVNYAMGAIAHAYGVRHLVTLIFGEIIVMLCLGITILVRMHLSVKTK